MKCGNTTCATRYDTLLIVQSLDTPKKPPPQTYVQSEISDHQKQFVLNPEKRIQEKVPKSEKGGYGFIPAPLETLLGISEDT